MTWLAAQHEAAHAIPCEVLGGEVCWLSLRGRMEAFMPDDPRAYLLVLLAPRCISDEGTARDLETAMTVYEQWQATQPRPLPPFGQLLPGWIEAARTILMEHDSAYRALTSALYDRGFVTGNQVRAILCRHSGLPLGRVRGGGAARAAPVVQRRSVGGGGVTRGQAGSRPTPDCPTCQQRYQRCVGMGLTDMRDLRCSWCRAKAEYVITHAISRG